MLEKTTIICPNCNTSIDINSMLYQELSSKVQKEFQNEITKHRQEYKSAMEKLKEQEKNFQEKIKKNQEDFEQELASKLKQKEEVLTKTLQKKLQDEQNEALSKLQEELNQKSEQVKELHVKKIEVEKLKREKDEAVQAATLKAEQELSKKLASEKERIEKIASEQNELKLKQKEEQINQIKKQLEEAKRKSEQGSQQVQGEAGEIVIEEWLQNTFPLDEVEEIKKGQRGGDCLLHVNTREMTNCGTIYFESKMTKEFQPSWIEKFKADIREKGADVGILVTNVLPKNMENMGLVEGVWVCNFHEFKGLSQVLRKGVIDVASALKSKENRGDKMSLLYNYLTSNEFKMQIEAIVEGFVTMRSDLDAEKRAMARIWKQREKQIDKVLENTTALYGSIKGIAGNAIGHIEALELPYQNEEA